MVNLKSIPLVILSLFLIYGCEPPFMETYGPDNTTTEALYAEQTADSGYVAVGYTHEPGSSNSDVYVLKTSRYGDVQWENIIGGSGTHETGQMVVQTPDNGYLILANTAQPLNPSANSDIKVIKLGPYGNVLSEKTYDPFNYGDYGCSIQKTSDGGYIIAGAVRPAEGENLDVLLIKLGPALNVEYKKIHSIEGNEYAWSIKQTEDGGYIVSGCIDTFGVGGSSDLFLMKVFENLEYDWVRFYGDAQYDGPLPEVQLTTDGGYILASSTESYGAGNSDAWVIKTNQQGEVEWDQTYGGINDDFGSSILQVGLNDGYIIAGRTNSFASGYSDAWLIKINSTGEVEWNQTFGGSTFDAAYCVQPTNEGYVLAGASNSYSGDIGNSRALLIKTDESGYAPPPAP